MDGNGKEFFDEEVKHKCKSKLTILVQGIRKFFGS